MHSVHLFCTRFCTRFVFECVVLIIRLLSKTRTYEIDDFTVLAYFTPNLDSVKLS